MPDQSHQKILITGASGYLAGRILQGLENDFSLVLGARNPEALQKIPAYQEHSCVFLDMAEASSFRSALKGVDAVVHLAALNHQDCEKNPAQAQQINVNGTQALISAAIEMGVSTFLYMSTIHVYGTPLQGLLTESTKVHPATTYAKTHFQAEQALMESQEKIKGIVLRLANAIGAPVHPQVNVWNLVTNDLCLQAVRNRSMKLNSSGNQERNFVSIAYLTSAIRSLLLRSSDLPAKTSILNMGGSRNITIWQFAQLIQQRCQAILGYTPTLTRPTNTTEDLSNQKSFIFDCARIQSWVGEEQASMLSQAVDETLLFCKTMES
jgi:UDP-glucose 4-epimerase